MAAYLNPGGPIRILESVVPHRRQNRCRVLLVAFSMLCGSAHGADAESVADARCIVVAMKMSNEPAPTQQSAAMMTLLYYLGRLDARGSELDTENLIEKEAAKMTAAELRAEAVRCGAALTEKGQEIQKVGRDLARRDKE